MATPPPSSERQSYHPDCEAAINHQISLELYAASVYTTMASYFQRPDRAWQQGSQYFQKMAYNKREQAERLLWLQSQRGGRLLLEDVPWPQQHEWDSSLMALELAMLLAKRVDQGLRHLHRLATHREDAHLCEFLESHCLHPQAAFLQELGDHISQLRQMQAPETGLEEDLLHKLTLGDREEH
ncbi:ferritin heavy chain-like [Myotis daubentonii]|uniref:ferritin heavy chain-like n=1 Tax=Myotis daubentonii TaxID=98922 RepID=UPI002873B015|nr:ferritin heavy chain-like [Myotis daubentonii]